MANPDNPARQLGGILQSTEPRDRLHAADDQPDRGEFGLLQQQFLPTVTPNRGVRGSIAGAD